MKKGIIIYQSKYGATEKYVWWIQNKTGFDCIETSKASIDNVIHYETIVLCGGVYASGIAGLSFLKENIDKLRNKKIAVFCVGASHCEENLLVMLKEHNFTEDLKDISLFYGRGAWNERKMKLMDKILCKMLRKVIAKKDPVTLDSTMKVLLDSAGKNCDWTDERYLLPLLEFINQKL